MVSLLSEIPDEPCVDGAKEQLAVTGFLPRAWHIVQYPPDLETAKIGVRHKPGLFEDLVCSWLEALGKLGGAAALPDYGIVDGLACGLVPDHRGFALVGDTNCGYVTTSDTAFGNRLLDALDLGRKYLLGIVLHPARSGKDLLELLLAHRDSLAVFIKDYGATAGGALVDAQYVFHLLFYLVSWGFLMP